MAEANTQTQLCFDRKTGKLRLVSVVNHRCITLDPIMASRGFYGGYVSLAPCGRKLQITSSPFNESKTIYVETFHISCKSDTYRGDHHNYAGVIIYQYYGMTDWRTENRTHCKSGYIVIQDTDSPKVKQWRGKTDGRVHGAVYRNAFGEEVDTTKVIGEGFSIQGGNLKINSGVFNNPESSEYHDGRKAMSQFSAQGIKKVVGSWKNAGPNTLGCRNFPVKDLV